MSRRSGYIMELPDGRKAIIYTGRDAQPLMQQHEKVILHLVDDNYKQIIDEVTQKPKTLLRLKGEANKYKLIGFVD